MKRKPILNETLFLERCGNWRHEGPLIQVVVVKIGRKYFTCKMDWREIQFHLDSWRQVTEYSPDCILYESEQEHSDLRERDGILFALMGEFGGYPGSALSLETLRQIKEIITKAKEQ